jgi:glutamate-1-semialdehyde 2,1-aminomutase
VARCAEQPFFSFDDWFIGSTPIKRGIPDSIIEQTKVFAYNNLSSLEQLIAAYPNQLACVILEPSATEHPAPSLTHPGETYLHDVQRLCKAHGIVFVLDEMITGFRWHLKGAQHYYNIKPDLSTFGKAMANGFSVAAIAGRRDIMELGSIEFAGRERVFLLSTTHGAEMSGLGAFVKTVEVMQRDQVVDHMWRYGQRLIDLMQGLAMEAGLADYFKVGGIPCSPWYATLDRNQTPSLALRTLFSQEMIKQGVLMPWIALSFCHREAELDKTANALQQAFRVYAQALEQGTTDGLLVGDAIKPVFRCFN